MLDAALREHTQEQVQEETLRILQPGNEFLQHMVDEFCKIRARPVQQAAIACFWEMKTSNVGAIVGGQDRTVSSASRYYSM